MAKGVLIPRSVIERRNDRLSHALAFMLGFAVMFIIFLVLHHLDYEDYIVGEKTKFRNRLLPIQRANAVLTDWGSTRKQGDYFVGPKLYWGIVDLPSNFRPGDTCNLITYPDQPCRQ